MHQTVRRLSGLLLLLMAGCATVSESRTGYSPTPAERQLVILIERRLSYAYDVAWFKYQRQLPVSDPAREAVVRQTMVAEGIRRGVSAAWASEFFTSQMAASREFQTEVMQSWQSGNALPRYSQVDLENSIRPRISEVSSQMVALLADPTVRRSPGLARYAYEFLRQREYSPNVANVASAPLQ